MTEGNIEVKFKSETYSFKVSLSIMIREFKKLVASKIQINSSNFDFQQGLRFLLEDRPISKYYLDGAFNVVVKMTEIDVEVNYQNEIFTIKVPRDSLMRNIRKIIAAKINLEERQINLMYENTCLLMEKSISKYNNEATIKINVKLKKISTITNDKGLEIPEYQLTVIVRFEQQTLTFKVGSRIKIKELKSLIKNKLQNSEIHLGILFNGEKLIDNKTLGHYGLVDGDTVLCFSRLYGGFGINDAD